MHPYGAFYAYTPLSLCSQLLAFRQKELDRNQSSINILRIELRVVRIIQKMRMEKQPDAIGICFSHFG